MANLSKDGSGWRVMFYAPDKKRRTIRLGKASKKKAEGVLRHIEELNSSVTTRQAPALDTAQWVRRLDAKLYDRIANAGLVQKRERASLSDFLQSYIDSRADVEPSTRITYANAQRNLTDYFGGDKPITEITAGDAEQWRRWMETEEGLSEATASRRARTVKQFFRFAVRKRMIDSNPFDDVAAGQQRNPDKFHFITKEDTEKLINAAPDSQWRLLIALGRYAGLRVPSEPLALTWDDVDWLEGKITITSKKTKRHAGKGRRVIPIFPELRPYLEEAYELADEGEPYVITRYRDSTQNLRTQLQRIIKKAGLEDWPKLWVNMRSSRETELAETYPMHVVCYWIGNSQVIAAKHYLQVTEDHYQQASSHRGQNDLGGETEETRRQNGVELSTNASENASENLAPNPAPQPATLTHNESQPESTSDTKTTMCHSVSRVDSQTMGDTGLEPVTSAL